MVELLGDLLPDAEIRVVAVGQLADYRCQPKAVRDLATITKPR